MRSFPLHIDISSISLILTLLIGGVSGGRDYKVNRDILESTAEKLDTLIRREIFGEFITLFDPSEIAPNARSRVTAPALQLSSGMILAGTFEH